MSEKHLDLGIIDSLKEVMADDFSVLLDTFYRDSVKRINDLRAAVANSDLDDVRRLAHSFKGSSSNLGAYRLSELCLLLEQTSQIGNFDRVPPLIMAVEQEYAAVEDALADL